MKDGLELLPIKRVKLGKLDKCYLIGVLLNIQKYNFLYYNYMKIIHDKDLTPSIVEISK